MKKLMFAAAVAAGLAAFGDGIESANTVGYQQTGLVQNKNVILAVQFEATDGTTKLSKLLEGTTVTGVDFSEDNAWQNLAPQISVINASGVYDSFWYLNDGWYDNGTPDGAYKAGWCDGYGSIIDPDIVLGDSMWVKDRTGNGSFVVAGQVIDDDETPIVLVANKNALKSNPYPKAFDPNDADAVTFTGLTGVDYSEDNAWQNTATQISVINDAGVYDSYWYLNDGWYDNGTVDGGFKAGWCDGYGSIADIEIPAGVGYWINTRTGAITMTFKK